MKPFTYFTDCVAHNGMSEERLEALHECIDNAIDITWRTLLRWVPIEEIRDTFPLYSYRREHVNQYGEQTCPLHIKDDWAVSMRKSTYMGRLCYVIVHSGIEYIWLTPGHPVFQGEA